MRQPRSALRRAVSLFAAVALVTTLITAGIAPAIALTVNAPAAAPAAPAAPVLPTLPASTQFDITGFLQEATLGGVGCGTAPVAPTNPLACGTLKVNGHTVIVPSNAVVILPASAYTWQELFALSPAPYTGVATGMALADVPAPMSTYEVQVVGNRVLGGPAGLDLYIAGLVHISQQDLNSGAGYINFIDYATGEMRVGGVLGDPTTGARVRISDPVGRFGRKNAADARFAVDDANPTIVAGTGFPMCLPRVTADPNVAPNADDPLCPTTNRPQTAGVFDSLIQMVDPSTLPAAGTGPLDPRVQAPFEVGDYITFAGTLVQDGLAPTAGPFPTGGASSTYISAHTITNNVAIYTFPGTNPAYVSVDVGLLGTGGLTVLGAGEAVIRTKFEGMATDTTRLIHLYGVDFAPGTGLTSDRDFGTIGVDPGAAAGGAVKGRWRFRPPCAPFGTVVTKPDKQCVMNAAGTFLPAPREVRAVIEGQQGQVPGTPGALTAANGIFFGQYHAPIGELIFPENIPGTPIVENNFNTIPFLTQGGYSSSTGVIAAGALNPWPSNILPTPVCTPPTANAGGPYTAPTGGTISLNGTFTGTATGTITYAWTTDSGTLSNTAIANPTFTAGTTAANLTFQVTNACGTSTSATTVTVNTPLAPTVNHVTPITTTSGSSGSFVVTGSDPNVPAATPLTFAVTQAPPGTLTVLTVTQLTPTSATVNYTAPTLPLNPLQTTPTTVNLTITASNTLTVTSAPEFTTVTVNPLADSPLITATEYRTGKQRLTINASSSINSANVSLKLQTYACQNVSGLPPCVGGTYNPDPNFGGAGNTFTNNGGGIYILVLVGAPAPVCNVAPGAFATPCSQTPLKIQSNLGALQSPPVFSPNHALDKIRQ